MFRTQAEALAQRLPPLQVEAQRVAATVSHGMHGRRRPGQGETFWQFRRYQPTDQLRRIDWRRSARGNDLFVRETEWEAAQSVWIWRDASPSMQYRSHRNLPNKRERADVLAMALAILLIDGGENVALLGAGVPARGGAAGLTLFAESLAGDAAATSIPPLEALPRHSVAVLIADFLEPCGVYAEAIAGLAGRGCDGHCLQLLDPAEVSFPFEGRLRFEGTEREEAHLLRRADRVRGDYLDRLARHDDELRLLAGRFGWSFARHTTQAPAEAALLSLYAALAGHTGGPKT